ncbi:hypothetical protein [Streptomyces sp. NPDC088915]|uniref:hypothetical protein n=1 Tax=Streptomyces sp. NPDC088915 TaxID=3365912 RepID=UPI003816A1E8
MAEQDPNVPALFNLSALTPTAPPSSFMNLEVPGCAYMFGFLQTDGHLARGTGRKGRPSVEIKVRDAHILYEFQRLTPYYSSITERVRTTNFAEQHHSATWTLCALEARTTINELGIPYGKKSRIIRPPASSSPAPTTYAAASTPTDRSAGPPKASRSCRSRRPARLWPRTCATTRRRSRAPSASLAATPVTRSTSSRT